MKNIIAKIKLYALKHKAISVIILIIIIFTSYWGYKKLTNTTNEIRYVTTKVEKGIIVLSVSGTGQVSADNQIDLKPKSSGDIVYIGAKNGDRIYTGALIVKLDTRDAQKSVRDAEINLENAKLSLEKLKIQNSRENMTADLTKAYTDGFNAVINTFLDLPSIVNGLEDILNQDNLSGNSVRISGKIAQTYLDKAETSYYKAKNLFNKNKKNYTALSNNSSTKDIESIIKETTETAQLVSDATKNILDFVNFMQNDSSNPSSFTSTQNTLSTYTSTITSDLESLVSSQTNINDSKDSSIYADIDLRNAQLTVNQRENSLQDAKDNLADYFIRAPYAGTITGMTIKKGDQVSSSTVIATLITDKQIAEVTMNEVDVAKIQVGQKATLTFDAVPDLTITGEVSEIDSIGIVSQGVVTYNVKINFDTQDSRVKPSMSVSASIITDIKHDVLVVPNSAIKSQSGTSYIEMFDTPLIAPRDKTTGTISKIAPNKIPVEVGLSNDSQSEIISGIKENDEIVSRTILPTTTTTATAPSIFGSSTNRGGGNAVRIPTGR